jgi:UrcA family protein
MIRLLQVSAIALTVLGAAAAAHAESVTVTYNPADLAVASGRQIMAAKIAATADAYCRANPIGGTIAACRQDLVNQLTQVLEVRAVQYAKASATKPAQMARR